MRHGDLDRAPEYGERLPKTLSTYPLLGTNHGPRLAQVQDVGLIFLSAMATSIAHLSTAEGFSAQEALGTTLVTLVSPA